MNRPGIRSVARRLVLLAGLLGAASPVRAQAPTDQEITESQQRLEQIRREQLELRSEMTRIRSRVSDLSSEVTNLDRQVDTSSELVAELENQVDQRERQVQRNATDLLRTRDQLAERRAILHRRLRDIYKRGPLRTLEVLLRAQDFSDLLNRYKYLFLIAQHDRQVADDVERLEAELTNRERALQVDLAQLRSVRNERTMEYSQLAALRARQGQALENVQSRERTTSERIERLEQDEARLSDLVAMMERRRREAESASTTAAPEVATIGPATMGSLRWPIDGSVVYEFGRDPRPNGTAVRWNGVGIAATAGSAVHAVADGFVVLAAPFEGYGPTVILSHGGGYYTLYLYLQEVAVTEGDTVEAGQTVGTVGGTNTGEGAHIEFQLRVPGGQAVDPADWLTRR